MKNINELLKEQRKENERREEEIRTEKLKMQIKKEKLERIYMYSIKDISIIFPKLIELIDQKEFTWHNERVKIINQLDKKYMEQIEVGYLIEKSLNNDALFDINGKLRDLESLEILKENKEQFIPVCKRISEGRKYFIECTPADRWFGRSDHYWAGQAEPMLFLDFENNGMIDERHQELKRIVTPDLNNEYYPYLLSFIDYATAWRLENDKSCNFYEYFDPTDITSLVTPFVEEYKQSYQKRK